MNRLTAKSLLALLSCVGAMLALAPVASAAPIKEADCPECADQIREYNLELHRLDLILDQWNEMYDKEKKAEAAGDTDKAKRYGEAVDKLDKRETEQQKAVDKAAAALNKCLKEKCPGVTIDPPKPPPVTAVATCPQCTELARQLTKALQAVQDIEYAIKRVEAQIDEYADKALAGPLSGADKTRYNDLQTMRTTLQGYLATAQANVKRLKLALEKCEKDHDCGPKTSTTPGTPGETGPKPEGGDKPKTTKPP